MNITIKTAPLRSALLAVSRVIQKSPSDIMMAVHISCVDQDVIVSACSPHADLRIETGETFAKDFSFAVNAERLKQLVDRATTEELKLTVPADDAQPITLAGGAVRGKIKQLPAKDFPGVTEPREELFSIEELDVAKVLPSLRWAAAPQLFNKAIFQGISFVATPGQIRLACISGIGACFWTAEAPLEVTRYACISLLSAGIVSGIFDEARVGVYRNRVVFEQGGVRVGVPLLEGGDEFPLAAKLPKVSGKEFKIDRPRMVDAVRLCTTMAAKAGKLIVVRASEGSDADGLPCVKFYASGADGEIEQEVAIEGQGGIDCHLNGPQVTQALSACAADNLTVVVPQGKDAGVAPHKISCGAWEAVIMPVRV